jgi:hypothetical protein
MKECDFCKIWEKKRQIWSSYDREKPNRNFNFRLKGES